MAKLITTDPILGSRSASKAGGSGMLTSTSLKRSAQ